MLKMLAFGLRVVVGYLMTVEGVKEHTFYFIDANILINPFLKIRLRTKLDHFEKKSTRLLEEAIPLIRRI